MVLEASVVSLVYRHLRFLNSLVLSYLFLSFFLRITMYVFHASYASFSHQLTCSRILCFSYF